MKEKQNRTTFDAWLDSFFDAYYRDRPVNATFIGVHQYDDRLPDLSEAGQAAIASSASGLLADLRALRDEPLTPIQQIDRQLAEGFLEIEVWESVSAQFAWGNPSLFTGEAIFGILSLLLRPFAPLVERLDHAVERLNAIPRLLDGATKILHDTPLAWCERARRECAGAVLLLGDGLDAFLAEANSEHPHVRPAARRARDAFARFDALLEADLMPRASTTYACGAQAFELMLNKAHFLEISAEELERLALELMAQEAAALRTKGSASQNSHVPEPYLERYTELWRAARDLARRADLLTFPAWPVNFVRQPVWVRESAPYFYFLPYRSPPPFDAAPVVDYLVPEKADESTIKLNHVIHHGSLGHHIQNWHAMRAPSRIGQVAAVDCASRIAMLCGGTMAEGWACYATDLADEAGFLTPAESIGQHTAHIRMAARAVVDIRLHQARMSLDEAAAFYVERVGLSPAAATAEAVKNSLFPGAACMYFAGWDAIRHLRREFTESRGMSLRQFHERLLGFGSIPVTHAGWAMRAAGGDLEQYHQPRHGHASRARGN